MRSLAAVLVACVAAVGAAEETARSEPPPFDTQKDAPPLSTPQQAVAAIRLPAGYRASLYAAEPLVRQPISFTTDARGRIWVAENDTYAERPVSLDERFRDRIVILEDVDGDGDADRRTVFADGLMQLTSVEVGFGGAFALCPPQLLFLSDRDGDDRFDGSPVVLLDGFDVGAANRHNFANGLKWGPDGWLYGRNGITHVGRVAVPGGERVEIGPGVWRYHPQQKRVELVCTGTTNPWGHDWDEHGELFFINTVIGHLWHAVPGAHFRRMFGPDSTPNLYELLDQNADHVHWDTREAWNDIRKGTSPTTDQAGGGHAHSGLLIYQGDNWPAEQRGRVFTVNLHGRRINSDRIERHGDSYVARHLPDFAHFGDVWFRGIDLLTGPDGAVYVADWSDVGECHENDGVHRSSGRIYRLEYAGDPPAALGGRPRQPDLALASDDELVRLQSSPNVWHARQARRILQERAARGHDLSLAEARLRGIVEAPEEAVDPVHRLRALWAFAAAGGASEPWLIAQLDRRPSDEHLRAWLVRLLVDRFPMRNRQNEEADPDGETARSAAALTRLAEDEDSGLVRVHLASALQRLPLDRRWPIAERLVRRGGSASRLVEHGGGPPLAADRVLPLMIWYGIEPAVARDPERGVALLSRAELPLVEQYVARRITQEIRSRPAAVDRLVATLAEREHPQARLRGMTEALRGWRSAPAPASWERTRRALEQRADKQLSSLVRELSVVFGDGRALDELRALAASPAQDLDVRRAAVQTLVEVRAEGLLPLLAGLLTEHDLAPDVVRGIAQLDPEGAPRLLLDQYGNLYPPGRDAVVDVLSSRPASARALVEAVAAGKIDRGQVSLFQIRQMQQFDDEKLQARLRAVWPELRPIAADKKPRIAELKAQLAPEFLARADAARGRKLWENSCAKCHRLFGEGSQVGPDLTGAQRSNLDYLLENIVDPSASLAAGYRMTTIVLDDGRVLNGLIVEKADEIWTVQTPTERVTVRTAEIAESKPTELSLMPDGQLDLLKIEEVRDLFKYLASPEQVPK